MSQWYLDSLEINGGFLPGFSLQFPRGLTCIIGPRGSGKSTLIEALRFGVGGVKEASKTRLELIQSNLGSQSIITIKTSNLDSDSGFTIRRSYGQSPSLLADDGNILDTVDLDRGTVLPLDAYSSSEIEGIADERLEPREGRCLTNFELKSWRRSIYQWEIIAGIWKLTQIKFARRSGLSKTLPSK